jgi:ketosteroid isomerase-like protein
VTENSDVVDEHSYDMVMENWKVVFNWIQHFDFSLDEVRVRVRGDVAWVTVKEFVNASVPLLSTNCFELHNGEWFMVHRHSSPQMEAGVVDFGQIG